MIRVTVELIPKGDESRKRHLQTMEICNDGTHGDSPIGDYMAVLNAEYTGTHGRKGILKSFNRKRQSVWSLIGGFLKLFGHTKHSPKLMTETVEQPTGGSDA